MSRTHDGQHRSPSPFGNLFKAIRTKDCCPRKIRKIQESFEQSLTENLTKLRPEETSDITSFSWLRRTMRYLCELHTSISSLITELELPVSNWDQQWIDIYLDDSVKLLDLCNAFSSGISSMEHGQLLLQCSSHILGKGNGTFSQEQLRRAHGYLDEWRQTINSKNPKLDSSSRILKSLSESLRVPNFKKSDKGRVLMRAMYAVKAITIFLCSMLLAALTGSSQHLIDSQVSKEFPWAEAFGELQKDVSREFRRKLPLGRVAALKEMDAVGCCVDKLFPIDSSVTLETKNTSHAAIAGEREESEELKPTDDVEDEKLMTVTSDLARNLESRTKILGNELGDLSKKTRDFFQIVMDGRDALLSNLRNSEFLQVKSFRKSKSI